MHYKRKKPVPKCGVIIFRNRIYDSVKHAADETGYSEATVRRHVYKSKRESSNGKTACAVT